MKPPPFDDPYYDDFLDRFVSEYPSEFSSWRQLETQSFKDRPDPNKPGVHGAYPNQDLRRFCQKFIAANLPDEVLSEGEYQTQTRTWHVWRVLRGRILRSVLDEEPSLNPAPGKTLVSDPRVCTDSQLVAIGEEFKHAHPDIWNRWQQVEAQTKFDDDPLRRVSLAFYQFVQITCWVQSGLAATMFWMDARGLFFHSAD